MNSIGGAKPSESAFSKRTLFPSLCFEEKMPLRVLL